GCCEVLAAAKPRTKQCDPAQPPAGSGGAAQVLQFAGAKRPLRRRKPATIGQPPYEHHPNDPEGRLPYPKRGHPQSKIGLGENGMCEERIAENGARAKRKKNPEQSERPFRAACGLPAKIHAVVAPEDGVQGVATLAFRVLAG